MVIPVHDVNPVRRTPVVTYLLIAANVVVFLLTPGTLAGTSGARQSCEQLAYYDRWSAIPKELVSNDQLPRVADGRVGVDAAGRVGCVAAPPTYDKPPFLSAITSQFLHGGWLHLLGNMLFLFIFGNNVEDRFGRLRFLLFYLGCGIVAAYGFALAQPDSTDTLIGASGAIAGVLGAYLALWPRARVWSLVPFLFFIPLRLPAWLVLGLWFVVQWAYSSGAAVSGQGSVAYLAHVVGFVVGFLVGLANRSISGPPPDPSRYRRPRQRSAW